MIAHAKLFGDNGRIVLPRNQQIYTLDSAKKIYFQVYHFSDWHCQPGESQLARWMDGARPPPRNFSKYIQMKIDELYLSDVSFSAKNIQQ